MAIASRTANAFAFVRIPFIQHDSQWGMEGPQAIALKIVTQVLNAGFVLDCRLASPIVVLKWLLKVISIRFPSRLKPETYLCLRNRQRMKSVVDRMK